MATDFDPSLMQRFADDLYRRASTIAFSYGAAGFLLGLLAGVAFNAAVVPHRLGDGLLVGAGTPALITGVIAGLLAYAIGDAKAFTLRLEAQRTLCQLAVERNTRTAATAAAVELANVQPSTVR